MSDIGPTHCLYLRACNCAGDAARHNKSTPSDQLLQQSGAALWHWPEHSHELHFSQTALQLLRLSCDAPLPLQEVIHAADWPSVQSYLSASWQFPAKHPISFRLRSTENTTDCWLQLSAGPKTNNQLAGLLLPAATPANRQTELQQLQQWLQLIPEGLALVRRKDGVIVLANPPAQKLVGWSEEEAAGHTGVELGLWCDAQAFFDLYKFNSEKKALPSREARLRHRSGREFEALVSAQQVTLDGEDFLLITLLDNSKFKRNETALQASETKFSKAFQNSPDAVVISEKKSGRLIEINRSFERILGWTADEAIGRNSMELELWVNPEDRIKLVNNLESGITTAIRTPFRARDGRILQALLHADEFEIDGIQALVLTVRDITQQSLQEQALKDSQERLELALGAVDLGTWDWHIESDRLYASARCAALQGLAEEPVDGRMTLLFQHVKPSERVRLLEAYQQVISGQKNQFQIDYQVQLPDGGLRYLSCSAKLYRDASGKPQRLAGIMLDNSERILREQELKASEAKFTSLFHNSVEPMCLTRPHDGSFCDVNARFIETFGWTAAEIIGRTVADINFYADIRERSSLLSQLQKLGNVHNTPIRLRTKHGEVLHCLGSAKVIEIAGETFAINSMIDITQQLEAEAALKASQEKFAKAFNSSPDAISIVDLKTTRYLEINEGFTRITGYSSQDMVGQSYVDLNIWATDLERPKLQHILETQGRVHHYEIVGKHKNGSALQLSVSIEPFELNGASLLLTTSRDISEIKTAEARIQRLAYHDSLTGLPNRALLTDRLTQQIALLKRHKMRGALLFLDLDHFKQVNDSLGHATGDALLKVIAARLESSVRQEDTVARLGGDEFVVLYSGFEGDRAAVTAQIFELAEKLRALLGEPMQINGHQLQVTPSIGIALLPDHGMNPADLLKHADIALYRAKDAGRNTLKLFRKSMLKEVQQRQQLEGDLRLALLQNQFELYFQPQVDTRSDLITGAEVLLRWQHPTLGQQSPAKFIEVLEASGLIVQVGTWVLNQACQACVELLTIGLIQPDRFSLSVNISPRQFGETDFVASVASTLAHSGLPASMLKLEVTESIVIQNLDDTIAKMHQLKKLGIGFAMDDFGTGYSSLTYLKRLPVDVLKIDQSFVRDATRDPNDAEIIRAIAAMARSLSLEMIAEGVEEQGQLDFLTLQGCHLYQGYLFSKPLPLLAFREVLLLQQPTFS